jgi:hypothetical protein
MALTLEDIDYSVANCANKYKTTKEAWDIFFPEGKDVYAKTQEAKDTCAGCPMLEQCFILGTQNKEWGIWGGATRAERIYLSTRTRLRREFLQSMKRGKAVRVLMIKDENSLVD